MHAPLSNTFHFLLTNKLLIIRTETYKILVRVINTEDPDQTASSGLRCLSTHFWQAASVRNLYHLPNVYRTD